MKRDELDAFINKGCRRKVEIESLMELVAAFRSCIELFDAKPPFQGPSVYFHERTCEMHTILNGNMTKVCRNTAFIEKLYGTLACWGMHRMGNTFNHMVCFDEFKNQIMLLEKNLNHLQNSRIANITSGYSDCDRQNVDQIGEKIWSSVCSIKIAENNTHLVGGTKVLHHLLPNLVPPIDRTYSLKFFYGNDYLSKEESEHRTFLQLFRCYYSIAHECEDVINSIYTEKGHAMNTSFTKIIDNAVVGYKQYNENKNH